MREPIFSEAGIDLYWGDAVEVLNELPVPAKSADMIFADPPYRLSNDGMSLHAGRRISVNKGEWDRSQGIKKDFEFYKKWIDACRRVLKPDGTLWISGTYHSIYACGFALQQGGWHLLNEICWYKPNAPPHLACRMFAASHETLIWAKKTKSAKHTFHYKEMRRESGHQDFLKKANRQMRSVWGVSEEDSPTTTWAFNTPSSGEKVHGKHPTQKPLKLLERILRASTKPKDVVLDPFCGSATTGVAAVLHNREFVGIDNNKTFLNRLAIPRLKDAVNGNGRIRDNTSNKGRADKIAN